MEGGPDVAQIRRDLKAAGLDPDCYQAPDPVPVWPDNEGALAVFLSMMTQWNCGPGGAVGLRYEALSEVWERVGLTTPEQRDLAFFSLQVMEREALLWIGERAHD
jgi:hypothetical protein